MSKKLKIWKEGRIWYFNDEKKGIEKEPFVGKINDILTYINVIEIIKHNDKMTVLFDSKPFKGWEYSFSKKKEEGDWTEYSSKYFRVSDWLCPVLYQYFKEPPETIYLDVKD